MAGHLFHLIQGFQKLKITTQTPRMSPLIIADRAFHSRLLLGTGKFPSNESMSNALAASGTEIVTVALRRTDLTGKVTPLPISWISSIPRDTCCSPTPAVR